MTGLGSPNVGAMVAYLSTLLANTTRAVNISDPVTAPVTFPTSGPVGTVFSVFSNGLSSPAALAMNGTQLLVSDYFSDVIITYDSLGALQPMQLSTSANGSLGMAVDAVNDLIYFALSDEPSLVRYAVATRHAQRVPLPVVPRGMAVQPGTGDVYIAGLYNTSLSVLFHNGSFGSLSNPNFGLPSCVAFDPVTGTLFVGNSAGSLTGTGSLVAINVAGDVLFVLSNTTESSGPDSSALDIVTGVGADGLGHVYVLDQGNGALLIVDAMTGSVLNTSYGAGAGNSLWNSMYSADGFVLPFNVAVDPRGYYIYVSDGAAGNVVQLAGVVPVPAVISAPTAATVSASSSTGTAATPILSSTSSDPIPVSTHNGTNANTATASQVGYATLLVCVGVAVLSALLLISS